MFVRPFNLAIGIRSLIQCGNAIISISRDMAIMAYKESILLLFSCIVLCMLHGIVKISILTFFSVHYFILEPG